MIGYFEAATLSTGTLIVFNLHVQPYPQSAVSEVCFCFTYLFNFFAVQDT